MDDPERAPAQGPPSLATHWSLLLPRSSSPESRTRARAYFYERYAPVLLIYFRRKIGGREDAQDLVQEFFTQALEKHLVEKADPERGRFRSFLFQAATNFLVDDVRARRSRKRRPPGGLQSLDQLQGAGDDEAVPGAGDLSPEAEFDRSWALGLIGFVRDALAAEYRVRGKERDYQVFQLRQFDELPAKQVAERLGLTLPNVNTIHHRVKAAFGRRLREEVAATVRPGEVEDEICYLLGLLRP